MKIALDVMGGDHAPDSPLDAVAKIVEEAGKRIGLVLVGDQDTIAGGLRERGISADSVEILHASEVISMHDAPALAIRRKKNSSISLGMDLVKEGKADAIVSAGNTGAMVAASKLKLRTLQGIERPALALIIPNTRGIGVLLDVGANSECKPSHFLQFAVMGRAYANHILGIENPSVGLMSIGEESSKGSEVVRQSHKLLKEHDVNFAGNVEGNNIFDGSVDVIVCDGFTGNVIIKTAESQMRALEKLLKMEIRRNILTKISAFFLKPVLRGLKKRADYEEYGGAPLLGVRGVCIICHGMSSPRAIKNAILVAENFVKQKVNDYIEQQINKTGVFERNNGSYSEQNATSISA